VKTVHQELVLSAPDDLKAIAHPIRSRILQVLDDRPASAKQLSVLLGESHGKIGHHLGVLADRGLVAVVEERKVRALTEKLFGLTYQTLRVEFPEPSPLSIDRLGFLFGQAAREAAPATEQPFSPQGRLYSVRMSDDRAEEFARRLVALADEFADASGSGRMFGFAGAVYATNLPEDQP